MDRKKIEFLQKCRKRKFLNNDDGENATTSDHFEHTNNNNDRDEDLGEKSVIINFELGKTQKGGNCLWSEGFRYVLEKKNRWNCSVRNCPARVTITDNSDNKISGYLGQRDHNHLPEPQKQQAESRRQKILQCVKAEPRLKPTRLLAEVRRSTADETYVAMGSDNALSCMMRRQKKKILGNVDCADPLAFVIPDKLRIKNGEEIVLYDSRTVRIGLSKIRRWCTRPWEEAVVRRALFPIPYWNVHSHAASALARTNNGLEATHLHFSKGLCHHPALSDFISEVNISIDKQVDAARSARNFVHKRHKRYVLQDAVIMRILADATYDNDAEIHDVMTALGLQVEGYAGKLKDYENAEDSIADDVAPPAPSGAVDDFTQRTSQFFDFIHGGNTDRLRALIESLSADELNTLLQMNDPRYTRERCALIVSIIEGHTEIAALLLDKGADVHQTTLGRVNNVTMAVTPLWLAVNMLQLELCRVLIAHGANVDLGSDSSLTPLLLACDKGSTEIVTLLVENGANLNLGDSEGMMPLMVVCRAGRIELARFLLSHGANVEQIDFSGMRFALLDAVAKGHLEVCRLLVEEWAADVNQQAVDGITALMGACIFGRLDITVFLIEHGAHIDQADMDGYNALMWAVKYEKAGVVRHLLAIGANADQVGIDGKRARDLARESRRAEMIDLFRTTANNEQREDGNAQQDEQPQQQQ
ncbi:hypothetical protein niasHT_018910 [Heterodera trifolii]|uniref:FLYWCH-type domain-containing protein n=1 Tax=Heterodera trifolii TaxID=157864 RepID=A0ABD2LDJ2_9BILA